MGIILKGPTPDSIILNSHMIRGIIGVIVCSGTKAHDISCTRNGSYQKEDIFIGMSRIRDPQLLQMDKRPENHTPQRSL